MNNVYFLLGWIICASRGGFLNIGSITLNLFIMKKITLLLSALVSLNLAIAQTDYYPVYDGTFDGTVYMEQYHSRLP